MIELRLTRTQRYVGIGDKDDYLVVSDGRVIGRIFLHPQAREATPWYWTITDMSCEQSASNKGYAATRTQAMMDFRARYVGSTN